MLQARQFPAVRGIVADSRRLCFVFLLAASARADSSTGSCEQAAQVAVLPSPLAPWKGSPLQRPCRRGKAASGRAFADRARRQRRGPISRSGGGAALLLVRGSGIAGGWDLARDADTRWRTGRLRHDHARHHGERRQNRQAWRESQEVSGLSGHPGIGRRRISFRHGSQSCSTGRLTRSCRGRRGSKCCTTVPATCCSTIWVSAKTIC